MKNGAASYKTAEEHLEMLKKSVSLMLWHAFRWSQSHPEEPLEEILEKRVDIFRRTQFHPGEIFDFMYPELSPEWQQLKKSLVRIASISNSAEEYEERAFELVEPFLEGRVERDLLDLHEGRIFANYKESCLYVSPKALEKNLEEADLHIANSCYPNSFFDDPNYLSRSLFQLIERLEKLGVKKISANTWLNSFPPWLRYFPQVWRERRSPPRIDTEDHLGFWGQFLTARQTFASAVADKMRKSGVIPYPMRHSWCTLTELRDHLEKREEMK